ncbi:MAG: DnaJ domain-containing protein [Acidobacteriota bacterium]
MGDYYRILGVSRKATQNEIRSAYRKLARKNHPDVSQSPEAAKQFALISEAYRVLSNTQLRALYDQGGEELIANQKRRQDQHAQRTAYQVRINRVVDEMIAEERAEVKVRSQAVTVVVTLFASTFFVAVAKPSIFDSIGLFWKVIIVTLSFLGLRYLYQSLRKIIERYTYIPEFPSITRLVEPPKQPFRRRTALTFLICGYAVSLTLGTIMGYWVDDGSAGPYFDNGYLINVLLLPPIVVFIIHLWRFLVAKFDDIFGL